MPDTPGRELIVDESAALDQKLQPVINEVLSQSSFLEQRLRERYPENVHIAGSSILIPRLESHGWRESAKLIDTLVLLYDKIYWDSIPNNLLIPECARDHQELGRFGVDERFPDRLIEYMRQGIVTPIVEGPGRYSLPTESIQEAEMPQHLIYTSLPLTNWFSQQISIDSYCDVVTHLPASQSARQLACNSAAFVRLLTNVIHSRTLRTNAIFVADEDEQFQWAALSGMFGPTVIQAEQPVPLDSLSLLRLFEGLLLASPSRLSIDTVLKLREQLPSEHLRAWLNRRTCEASRLLIASDPVTYILADFEELVNEAVAKSTNGKLFKLAFSALAATLGAFVGNIPGALTGSVAGYLAGELANQASQRWYERFGRLNWVLAIHEYRKTVHEV